MRKLKIFLLVLLLLPLTSIKAETEIETIHFFYKDDCQYCDKEEAWLDTLDQDENVLVHKYNIGNPDDFEVFESYLDMHEITIPSVPLLVYENQVFVGYLDQNDFVNQTQISGGEFCEIDKACQEEKLLLGFINPKNLSFPLLAAVLGLIDGFNPCAMWVLIILLSFLIQFKDRKKMAILGTWFIAVTGLMYYLIIASWINVRPLINSIAAFQTILALILLAVGLISFYKNIKKEAGCKAEESTQRSSIIKRISKIVNASSMFYSLLTITLLAITVNLIELTCSLGIPLMFTEILSLNRVSGLPFQAYLLIYIFFFVLDDLIIFGIALYSFKIKGISNRFTKKIQNFGSILLILFALIMLFKPSLLVM